MWDFWFEFVVILALLGILVRLHYTTQELKDFHDCFHYFEEQVMKPQDEVHVDDGKNLRVMGLEDFMDEFGFDPRISPEEVPQDNRKEIDAWDNE